MLLRLFLVLLFMTASLAEAQQVRPSYRAGYARSAAESANPGLWDGLVGAWVPSLGVTGGKIRNIKDVNNDSTLTLMDPATDWVTSKKGFSLSFDGTDDFSTGLGDQDNVLETFVIELVTGASDIFNRGISGMSEAIENTTHDREFITDVSSKFVFYMFDGNEEIVTGTTTAVANTRYLIVGVIETLNIKIYVNGKLEGTEPIDGPAFSGYTTPEYILGYARRATTSGNDAKDYWNGKILMSLVYDRVLNANEVMELNLNPNAPFELSPQSFGKPPATTLLAIRSSEGIRPSYRSGFARSAGESEYPGLWDGLIGAWVPGLGATGSIVKDVSGNGKEAVFVNMEPATDWVISNNEYVLNFDGVDEELTIADVDSRILGGNARSILIWFNADAFATTANDSLFSLMSAGGLSAGEQFVICAEDNGVSIVMGGGRPIWDKGNLAIGVWHFFAVTLPQDGDSDDFKGYINGVEKALVYESGGNQTINSQTDTQWSIGGDLDLREYNGKIGRVYLYDRVLTPSEIVQLNANPSAPFQERTQIAGAPGAAPPAGRTRRVMWFF